MAIRIVRLGSARSEGEGVRLGTVRRPPRGVKKADFAVGCYCENAERCHRSLLKLLLAEHGAEIV